MSIPVEFVGICADSLAANFSGFPFTDFDVMKLLFALVRRMRRGDNDFVHARRARQGLLLSDLNPVE